MNKLIKSPINYTGNKWKLLPTLLELFPNNISVFMDLFGGGATVSLNVKAEHIVYNDIVPYVTSMFSELQEETLESALSKIYDVIKKYELSKINKDGFINLRNDSKFVMSQIRQRTLA